MKKNILILLAFIGTNVQAQNLDTFFSQSDAFFMANVKNGKVAYSNIHKSPEALNTLLANAEKISVSESDAKNYQAFWICLLYTSPSPRD